MRFTIDGGVWGSLMATDMDKETSKCPPRVSVVIPCYNLGEYLEGAVRSVREQTFKDYEIIIVNDGSTDAATVSVLAEMSRQGIEVVNISHRGPSAARNEGIRRGRGKYVLPLDADDCIAPKYLEHAIAILDARPEVGIVYGLVELFGEVQGIWEQPEYSPRLILQENMIVASAVFRRSDWEYVGGYRCCMVYGWEDWDFWLSLVELGRTVVRLPEIVFHYRIRFGSRTGCMKRWHKLRMLLNLVFWHKKLYLGNFDVLLALCLCFGRRHMVSPRDGMDG